MERKFSSAGSLLVAYTNSKLISDTDTLTNWLEASNGSIQDNNNNAQNVRYLLKTFATLVISYVLDLPFGHGRRYFSGANGVMDKIIGGWGLTV